MSTRSKPAQSKFLSISSESFVDPFAYVIIVVLHAVAILAREAFAGFAWRLAILGPFDDHVIFILSARDATAYQHQLAAVEDSQILAMLDPSKNEVIRLTDAERTAFVRASQSVLDRHRKELDPKLFAYLGT